MPNSKFPIPNSSYNRIQIFFAACIGLFVFGMTLITLGSILPKLQTDLGESLKAGTATAVLPFGILFGSLIFGPIVDRYGYKTLLIISVLISAIALEGLAISKSASLVYLCIFFIGFGGGIINGGTSALVADISVDNKGANLSLLGVSFGVGALGMPLLLGLFEKSFSYNLILTTVSAVMLIPVIYYLFLKFPSPKQTQGFPVKQGITLIKQGTILLTSFFLFFQSAIEALNNNWTTSYLETRLGVGHDKALLALSCGIAGLAVARLLLGALLQKISSFTIMIFSLILIALANLAMYLTRSYEISFTALIVAGFGLAAGFPVILGYVGQLYPQISGTAFSISLVIALIGNMLINYSFGEIAGKNHIEYLPLASIILVIMMILLMILIRNKLSNKIKI